MLLRSLRTGWRSVSQISVASTNAQYRDWADLAGATAPPADGSQLTGKASLLGTDEVFEIVDGKINGKDVSYGLFIGEIVNFLIVALALYIFIVKFIGMIMKNKKEEAAAIPPPLTKDQELLIDIRELLKNK